MYYSKFDRLKQHSQNLLEQTERIKKAEVIRASPTITETLNNLKRMKPPVPAIPPSCDLDLPEKALTAYNTYLKGNTYQNIVLPTVTLEDMRRFLTEPPELTEYFSLLFACDRNNSLESSIVSFKLEKGVYTLLNKTVFEDLIDNSTFLKLLKKEISNQRNKHTAILDSFTYLVIPSKIVSTDYSTFLNQEYNEKYDSPLAAFNSKYSIPNPEELSFRTREYGNPKQSYLDPKEDIFKLRSLLNNKKVVADKTINLDVFSNLEFTQLNTVSRSVLALVEIMDLGLASERFESRHGEQYSIIESFVYIKSRKPLRKVKEINYALQFDGR